RQNTDAIKTLLEKSKTVYHEVEAKKDSFKVEMEAVKRQEELQADLLMISASRDYGIDDIIFGPKEEKIVKKSTIPVMVINPRKDLYALCG
ncbi:MAG: universal stress protein, partial [Paludibacteraceae bacterium]|nr:universal stress protein [Paludibacteraceae bacterium]